MASRGLNRIIYSATRSPHANHIARHPWLRQQVLKRRVDIAWPFLRLSLSCLLWRQLIKPIAIALAKSAVVQRQHIDSRRRKLLRQSIPNFALPVALMQKQHARPRFRRSQITRLKLGAVTRGQIHNPFSGPTPHTKCKNAQQKSENAKRNTTHNAYLSSDNIT